MNIGESGQSLRQRQELEQRLRQRLITNIPGEQPEQGEQPEETEQIVLTTI